MKKFVLIFIVLLTITVILLVYNNISIVDRRQVSKDLTVSVDNEYLGPVDINMIRDEDSRNEYFFGHDLNKIFDLSEEIVRGKVENISFTKVGAFALTKADILITESFKGKLKKGDLVSVLVFGGYIRLQDYLKAPSAVYNTSDLSEDEIGNIVLKQTYNGRPFLTLGDDQFFCLIKTSPDRSLPKGCYELVSANSELYLDNDGKFVQEYYDYDEKGLNTYRINEIISMIKNN